VTAVANHRTGPRKGKPERAPDFLLREQRGTWKVIASGDTEQWGEYVLQMPPPVRRRFEEWKVRGRD
jgi:hypothetical protein